MARRSRNGDSFRGRRSAEPGRAKVFLVQHVQILRGGEEDVKLIGIYSTKRRARAAVERARKLPGFRQARNGFHIDACVVDQEEWREGYVMAPVPDGGALPVPAWIATDPRRR